MIQLEKGEIMKIGLAAFDLLSSVPANAHEYLRGSLTQRSCYKETYREKYIAGTSRSKGYVKSFRDKVEVPCNQLAKVHHYHYHNQLQQSIPTYNYSRTRYSPQEPLTAFQV